MKSIEDGQSNNTYESAPSEWKEFFNEFKSVRKDVLSKIFQLDDARQVEYLEKIKEKEQSSFSSASNPHEYLVYHMSIGGSIGPIDAPNLDFESEYSLMNFYQKLQESLAEE